MNNTSLATFKPHSPRMVRMNCQYCGIGFYGVAGRSKYCERCAEEASYRSAREVVLLNRHRYKFFTFEQEFKTKQLLAVDCRVCGVTFYLTVDRIPGKLPNTWPAVCPEHRTPYRAWRYLKVHGLEVPPDLKLALM